MNPTADPAPLQALYDGARHRGNGDVDAGAIKLCGNMLAHDYDSADWLRQRDRLLFPRLTEMLKLVEQLPLEPARHRAAMIAIRATLYAQDILDLEEEHRAAAAHLRGVAGQSVRWNEDSLIARELGL